MNRIFAAASASLALCVAAGCATDMAPDAAEAEPRWQANGYLSPWRDDNPEIIGQYADRQSCAAAADGWTSRQVVGNPVFAECLPIDTH